MSAHGNSACAATSASASALMRVLGIAAEEDTDAPADAVPF